MKNRHLYAPHWDELSWMIRYGRADNRCERCGALNRRPHPVTGGHVILTVNHLNGNRRDDRAKNLLAVCNKCHFDHDRLENLRKAAATRAARRAASGAATTTRSGPRAGNGAAGAPMNSPALRRTKYGH